MRGTRILVVLLLVSCGSAKASPAAGTPAAQSVPEPVGVKASSTTPAPTDVRPAFPTRLALTTKDGKITTFSPHSDPLTIAAVAAPAGRVAVSAEVANGSTTVRWHELATDAVTATIEVKGEFRPTAVAQDGSLVALVSSSAKSTIVVLASPTSGEVRRWSFDAVVVPEAFADAGYIGGLPIGVFVIEYLAEHTYRVRVIDTTTGALGLPLNLRDKSQTADEVMTAVSRTAVFDPARQLLFTLYQNATEDGEDLGSFIHTLGLINGVWCLDVPPELGLADHPGALAVSPDGSRLFAASSTGGVAGYVVDDITNGDIEMPRARTTAALDGEAERVAVAASNDEVVVALGAKLFVLDPETLAVRDSFIGDMDVAALTVLSDGSIVIVGTDRMTLVSGRHELLAEHSLPVGTDEVTRVVAIG